MLQWIFEHMTKELTALLAPSTMILTEHGYSFTTNAEREIGRDLKEKLCYVAFDYDTELKLTAESSDKNQTHMLSDGNIIAVGAEHFRCASVFQPCVIGKETSGVHDTSFHNIMKCDVDIRENLYVHETDHRSFRRCSCAADSGTAGWRGLETCPSGRIW